MPYGDDLDQQTRGWAVAFLERLGTVWSENSRLMAEPLAIRTAAAGLTARGRLQGGAAQPV